MFNQIRVNNAFKRRAYIAGLATIFMWLMTSITPATAKTSVWLDDKTELRYASGWYNADGGAGNFIDININDIDIFEHGRQKGFIEKLILKTDGIGEDIVAIETLLLKNLAYSTGDGDTLTIAHMSGAHLMIAEDGRINAYRKRHGGNGPVRSVAEIKDILLYSERENIELAIAKISLDGLLSPTLFDALPNSSRSKLSLEGLVFKQIPGDRRISELDALFAMLGTEELNLDILMDFQSKRNDDHLQVTGNMMLSASSLMDINADFTLDLTKHEYQALNQLTSYLMETQTPQTQEAVNLALLSSLSSFSVDLFDRGILDIITKIQGEQARDVTIMMMQVSLNDILPRHARAIGTPIAAFLRQGGRLRLSTEIIPRLSPAEMLALQFDPEKIIDRIKLRFRHTPAN